MVFHNWINAATFLVRKVLYTMSITFLDLTIVILWCFLKFASGIIMNLRFFTHSFGLVFIICYFVFSFIYCINDFFYHSIINLTLLKNMLLVRVQLNRSSSCQMLISFDFSFNFVIFVSSKKDPLKPESTIAISPFLNLTFDYLLGGTHFPYKSNFFLIMINNHNLFVKFLSKICIHTFQYIPFVYLLAFDS